MVLDIGACVEEEVAAAVAVAVDDASDEDEEGNEEGSLHGEEDAGGLEVIAEIVVAVVVPIGKDGVASGGTYGHRTQSGT